MNQEMYNEKMNEGENLTYMPILRTLIVRMNDKKGTKKNVSKVLYI
jgi:hypothetical protein